MTIAACYVSPEGVVLGADSTSTYGSAESPHYYNNGQKLFEIGKDSTLGLVTWGLGGLQISSHRTLVALLADDLKANPPATLEDVANRWCEQFWIAYQAAPSVQYFNDLAGRPAFNPSVAQQAAGARTADEEEVLEALRQGLVTGFFVGGHVPADRAPGAFEIVFKPDSPRPNPVQILDQWRFSGAPNIIYRLLFGFDEAIRNNILQSGNWDGTEAELDAILYGEAFAHPILPIRDAIDFVYSCIHSTIKAMKFSSLSQICGGPIEIAVITSDRDFRWVRHKPWDSAIKEGDS